MSILRSFETKIAGLVEGTFSRAFRSEVTPVEIARRLVREMDRHRSISVSRTYVPNEYVIYLSPTDRERFAGYENGLRRELAGYLLEHARSEKLDLLSPPTVSFELAEELKLGEFGIQARLVEVADPEQATQQADFGHTMVYSAAERLTEKRDEDETRPTRALLRTDGKSVALVPEGTTIGRSQECDVTLEDPNISRRHAELTLSAHGWAVADLGSTNGVIVNGQKITRPTLLRSGDEVEIGVTRLTFLLE